MTTAHDLWVKHVEKGIVEGLNKDLLVSALAQFEPELAAKYQKPYNPFVPDWNVGRLRRLLETLSDDMDVVVVAENYDSHDGISYATTAWLTYRAVVVHREQNWIGLGSTL